MRKSQRNIKFRPPLCQQKKSSPVADSSGSKEAGLVGFLEENDSIFDNIEIPRSPESLGFTQCSKLMGKEIVDRINFIIFDNYFQVVLLRVSTML